MRLVDLIPLHEIDFPSQKAFDTYSKAHKLRPDTKVKIAGKITTAGEASKVKGTSVFGKDKGGDVFDKGDKKTSEDSIIPSDKDFTELGKKAGYNFNLGNCDLFARAMHRVTGYPIYVIKGWTEEDDWDEDGETELVDEPYHVMVKLPNGKFRDADGEYTLEELTPHLGLDPDNGIKKVTAEPIEDKDVKDVYGSNYKADEIKKVMNLITKNK
jgi:hypothetical protein